MDIPILPGIKDKVALVTGGASGIGKAIVTFLAKNGAHVCLLDKDESSGRTLVQALSTEGLRLSFHHLDVTDQEAYIRLCKTINETYLSIDILVNNAGMAQIGNLEQTSSADFEQIFSVNVAGVYNGMFAVIKYMKAQQSGIIVNIGSIAANVGLKDRFGYSMSKGAVHNITLTVAKDYIDDNIRCNVIAPARVHTPFVDGYLKANYPGRESEMFDTLSKTQPMGRMGRPEEVAHMVGYLCSDAATFITGTCLPLDGGFINLNT